MAIDNGRFAGRVTGSTGVIDARPAAAGEHSPPDAAGGRAERSAGVRPGVASPVEMHLGRLAELAPDIGARIEQKFRNLSSVHDRMDADYSLYALDHWQPDVAEALSPEDIYTTNEPRVLAEKVISFITATELVVRAPNDDARERQESANDLAEQLAIGMLNNIDRRHRRLGHPPVVDALAFFSVVRGRYAAARAVLRKRPNGETFEDILPLDPRHLCVQPGVEEPLWAAYRLRRSVLEVREEFPHFAFENGHWSDDGEGVDVFEYFAREENPEFDVTSRDPFRRHPFIYVAGTIVDGQWARLPHNLHMLTFPVVVAPVGPQPMLAPTEKEDSPDVHFGESIFAENRGVWDRLNRATSYVLDLTGKASDPRKKVFSLDGTKSLDDGANDKGAEINLSTANQEDVQSFPEADINSAVALLIQQLQKDAVAGGLPPQAFGLLDKPLSSVALRQLGNNLEHRVLPRMRAVARCIEGCLENLIAQYETGAFNPISVSGRRFDNHRFANRLIEPEDLAGHDPLEVSMALALPEDEVTRWTVAQMAMQPTLNGEPLASLEWVRERVLKMQSHRHIQSQNREAQAVSQDPLAQAMGMFTAALKDGDNALAAIWFDRLQVLHLQRQVEGQTAVRRLLAERPSGAGPSGVGKEAESAGLPDLASLLGESAAGSSPLNGGSTLFSPNPLDAVPRLNHALNPANGAIPFAQAAGVGSAPSAPDIRMAGAASQGVTRPGLVGADGEPLTSTVS
ncbi:MAG: hypothetical protein O3B04_04670 [Chloroflexi bacterium]|nr:hypothetical protein [Chloroflexota bacterium]